MVAKRAIRRQCRTSPISLRRRILFSAFTSFLALGAISMTGEFAIRVKRHKLLTLEKPTWRAMTPEGSVIVDPLLGYVPTATAASEIGSESYSTDHLGLRNNGNPGPFHGLPILAVGDSYTWGSEVDDQETWPSCLERISGHRVVNGGVAGYGLDQMVLRAEQLIPSVQPGVLVVDYIGDDVSRCEFAYRFAWKPYFMIENQQLVLQGIPVESKERPEVSASLLRSTMKYSYLADYLMLRIAPGWWHSEDGIVHVHSDGVEVGKLLMQRVKKFSDDLGLPVLVVFEYGSGADHRSGRKVLEHASQLGLSTLDLVPELSAQIKAHPNLTASGNFHLAQEGNEWVALRIANKLQELRLIDKP